MTDSMAGTEAGSWTDSSISEPPEEMLDYHATTRTILIGNTDMDLLAGQRQEI